MTTAKTPPPGKQTQQPDSERAMHPNGGSIVGG